ncbi:MAG: 1-aminocyclopropane-1-carboxylate deaminase [Campylobacterota bacterium]|nr:1-aminocyclopropane-1-carboxylate deaminase [Campylobacterota bacterium]
MKLHHSPTQEVTFQNHSFFIKRDDLLHPDFSGNKARKFHYFFEKEFHNIQKIVSHGSNQSNAMYSLSVLARLKGWKFDYYVDHVPSWLEQNPSGNYAYALENGMNILKEDIPKVFDQDTLFIDEGGAIKEAQYGIELLANEITLWAKNNRYKEVNIFLPSGTGTTALYLQKYSCFNVFTCPCVGDKKYLEQQFNALENAHHPIILPTHKKFHFGKLYKENLEMWKQLKQQTKIEFDLLYDPVGWQTLLQSNLMKQDIPLVYIHQGGLIGNITMLQRYERKFYNK